MFTINEDKSISVTRGDIVVFQVTAKKDGKEYTFLEGDILRMRVFGKKNCEKLMMVKDFPVNADTKTVEVFLGEEDTKFGPVISKPTAYWYEIELNPDTYPQTIIGYDEDGPREFLLYPEGKEVTEGAMDDRIKGDVQQIIENTVLANLPEIENDTWWVGGKDTGKPTRGERGNPGVYVGSGSMPADCFVQFDPKGDYVFGPPKIVDGTWWTWDDETGDYVDTGVPCSGPEGPEGRQGQQGRQGSPGEDGVGITRIAQVITGGPGEANLVRVYLTNGASYDLTTYNGEEGPAYVLTNADKTEIVEDVLAELPNAEEAEF